MIPSRVLLVGIVAGAILASAFFTQASLLAARRQRQAAQDALAVAAFLQEPPTAKAAPAQRPQGKVQPRASGRKVKVDPAAITVDDGDTVTIRWGDKDDEIVRILGIDTPETQHIEHNIPIDQPYGREAQTFAQGAFSVATDVELLRCTTIDPYGRTLGYLFLNGKNYSLLVIKARLAEESVSRYGDNGFPEIAAEVKAAAKAAGPLPFESPGLFRSRMRPLSDWMKSQTPAR
ncbi:MAG: nuc 1 [Planctomycetota bacterium]|nr:nuc 1 [Planctomycetota bacterium]